jgi:hypothetical protein
MVRWEGKPTADGRARARGPTGNWPSSRAFQREGVPSPAVGNGVKVFSG